MTSRACLTLRNPFSFRHYCLKRPLNDSMKALYVGLNLGTKLGVAKSLRLPAHVNWRVRPSASWSGLRSI